jgi:hypothetical protein
MRIIAGPSRWRAGEGEVDIFQGRAVDIEVGKVEATADGPVAEHLQVNERAFGVQHRRSFRPGPGQWAEPFGQVTRLQLGWERKGDGGGHVVAPAQRPRGAVSHDAPGGQHRDPVGQVLCLVHVMGGEEDRLA